MVKRLLACWWLLSAAVWAEPPLTVAVTASFKPVLEALSEAFTEASGRSFRLVSASTGVLSQQILAGAPFDIFFAADRTHPQQLLESLGLPTDRIQTYALGTLVLVTQDPAVKSLADLRDYAGRVIIANPLQAPYGVAADQILDQLGYSGTRVRANNVSQARQYLSLNLAAVGLTAASVAQDLPGVQPIDPALYGVLEQQLVVLRRSDRTVALLAFLQTAGAVQVLRDFGYREPGDSEPDYSEPGDSEPDFRAPGQP
ncbi:molybdate ABC transporter substrate-binding protein [Reinekea sp.]|uniref:molybdate ABC transporter substrate-binding protein n=1 Tax=Reinekea sp. TaxID=1970455 RepID=UPI002A824AA4|nr:molybdate ABC transporter substrate-binding protein [Reinekea sp.]